MNKDNIKSILARAQEGDQNAFSELLDIYKPLINSTVSKFKVDGMSEADVEDLRQEAVLAFYSALISYDSGISEVEFGLYAKVCICNRLVSQLRIIKRHLNNRVVSYNGDDLLRYVAQEGDPVKTIMELEEERSLEKLIKDNLSPRENKVFRLYAEGMSTAEMSERLKMSEKSINNAVYRIRKKLKKILQK